MYSATEQASNDGADDPRDDVEWYVRKFRLETAEDQWTANPEVPAVRSGKWLVAVAAVVIGLSALLALATFAVGP
jgi:hypothetical protein